MHALAAAMLPTALGHWHQCPSPCGYGADRWGYLLARTTRTNLTELNTLTLVTFLVPTFSLHSIECSIVLLSRCARRFKR